MVELRPLIIVTGTARVEGGEKNRVRYRPKGDNANQQVVTVDRQVTADRRAANVIATDHMRKLRSVTLLRTPYGVLVDPARLPELKETLNRVSRKIVEYNKSKRACGLTNCILWEHLRGQRLSAVAGWIDAELAKGNEEMQALVPELTLKRSRAA